MNGRTNEVTWSQLELLIPAKNAMIRFIKEMKTMLFWWKFSFVMKLLIFMKICQWDDNLWTCWWFHRLIKNQSNWWKFVSLMKIYHTDEIYHFNDMRSPYQPDKPCFSKSGCILPSKLWFRMLLVRVGMRGLVGLGGVNQD